MRADEVLYEYTRIEALRDAGWTIAALVAGLLVLLLYVWLVYRREARTISLGKAVLLASLRTIAVAGVVMFFLGLQRRSSSELVEPSRVVVLVDTSLSMNLPAEDSGQPTRAEQTLALFTESPLVEELTAEHDVELIAVDESARPVRYLPGRRTADDEATESAESEALNNGSIDAEMLAEKLAAEGHETRLGDAIAETLERYRGLPLAGIVLLTDGGQNAGLELPAAGDAAASAAVRVHSIGFGPLVAPANVAVRELIAPERAYPGDKITLQAVVHAQGLAARQIELQLFRHPIDLARPDGEAGDWETVATQEAILLNDDHLQTVRFETQPEEAGTYTYEIRVAPVPGESQTDDNTAAAEVAIVERKTKVLLMAGGPARDYRFLRNQLRRDDSFVVDVWLESGAAGISQDANKILTGFPTSPEQLAEYDAIVAFDPNWALLDVDQIRWLEQWVARQAGGLVVVPGRVNVPRWGIESRMTTIRGLYPVRLPDRLLELRSDEVSSDKPQPLIFTREGQEAEFLWLADDREESEAAWRQFAGVYGSLDHLGPKPGATLYAHLLSGNEAEQGPVYFASQYYGAGQVFYMGSSEVWRLRALDTDYGERLWTSLLRHVSQGRLLQGSPRGKLLVAQDRYEVGATVAVRAVMSDVQMEPLVAGNLPLTIEVPGGAVEKLELVAETERAGNFSGEFRVVTPGSYRLVLPVPDSEDQLTKTVRVMVPQLEVSQTVRDETALRAIAAQTGGHYYASPESAVAGDESLPPLAAATPSQARTKRIVGAIDDQFARQQSFMLLAVIAGALCLEWIVRRLNYLA